MLGPGGRIRNRASLLVRSTSSRGARQRRATFIDRATIGHPAIGPLRGRAARRSSRRPAAHFGCQRSVPQQRHGGSVGRPGLEPGFAVSETAVLPTRRPPKVSRSCEVGRAGADTPLPSPAGSRLRLHLTRDCTRVRPGSAVERPRVERDVSRDATRGLQPRSGTSPTLRFSVVVSVIYGHEKSRLGTARAALIGTKCLKKLP